MIGLVEGGKGRWQASPAFAESVYVIDGPSSPRYGFVVSHPHDGRAAAERGALGELAGAGIARNGQQILALGPVCLLVAGTPRHVWRLATWLTRFPDAQRWRPRQTLLTLQKGRLPYTGILGNTPPPDWSDDFDQLALQGNPLGEEIVFYHRASGTVILDDLVQFRVPRKGQPLSTALWARSGVASPHGGVGLDVRLTSARVVSPFTRWTGCCHGTLTS